MKTCKNQLIAQKISFVELVQVLKFKMQHMMLVLYISPNGVTFVHQIDSQDFDREAIKEREIDRERDREIDREID